MNRPQHTAPLITLILLAVLALLGNICLTTYYFDSATFFEYDFFVCLGLLVAQPCVLSIWCALGSENPLVRLPTSMGILFILLTGYIKTMEMKDSSIPLEVVILISSIAVALTAIVQIPLWIFRRASNQSIQIPSKQGTAIALKQFSIKQLLIVMTIAAIVVTVAQATFPAGQLNAVAPAGGWFQLALFLLFFVVAICLLTFLSLAVVFSQKQRVLFLVVFAVFLLACPYASFHFMKNSSLFTGLGMGATEMMNMYIFIFSIASGITSVLALFHRLGYRLAINREANG